MLSTVSPRPDIGCLPFPLTDISPEKVKPKAYAMALIDLLSRQSQDVLGHVILSQANPARRLPDQVLCWLQDQPLERANAIRLFWALFDRDLFLYGRKNSWTLDSGAALQLDLLCAVNSKLAAGAYPKGDLGISARESKILKIQFVEDTRDAVLEGWDQARDASFDIADACLMPLLGRKLASGTLRLNLCARDSEDPQQLLAMSQARQMLWGCLQQPADAQRDRNLETRQLLRCDYRVKAVMVALCASAALLGNSLWQGQIGGWQGGHQTAEAGSGTTIQR